MPPNFFIQRQIMFLSFTYDRNGDVSTFDKNFVTRLYHKQNSNKVVDLIFIANSIKGRGVTNYLSNNYYLINFTVTTSITYLAFIGCSYLIFEHPRNTSSCLLSNKTTYNLLWGPVRSLGNSINCSSLYNVLNLCLL